MKFHKGQIIVLQGKFLVILSVVGDTVYFRETIEGVARELPTSISMRLLSVYIKENKNNDLH